MKTNTLESTPRGGPSPPQPPPAPEFLQSDAGKWTGPSVPLGAGLSLHEAGVGGACKEQTRPWASLAGRGWPTCAHLTGRDGDCGKAGGRAQLPPWARRWAAEDQTPALQGLPTHCHQQGARRALLLQ